MAGSSIGYRSKAMNPTTGLKLSATFFAVFWTAGMVWWSGIFEAANIIITVICGGIAGYLWYRIMRWLLTVRQVPSGAPSGPARRKSN
jgi:predicted PurR-regulated permease PerM